MIFVFKCLFLSHCLMFLIFHYTYLLNYFLTKLDIYLCKNEMFCRSSIIQTITTNAVDDFINHQDTMLVLTKFLFFCCLSKF